MVMITTTIQQGDGNTTGIEVDPETMAQITDARRVAVRVTINGYSYASTLGWYRGAFRLPVSAEVREKAGVAGGDEVEVTIEADTAPRVVEAPADLRAALDADPVASAAWEKLAPSHRKAHVTAIDSAKAEETRARRIAKAVEQLRQP